MWFVELKRRPNRLAPEQIVWGEALTAAGADYRVVWVPEGKEAFIRELQDARPVTRRPRTTVIISDPLLYDLEAE